MTKNGLRLLSSLVTVALSLGLVGWTLLVTNLQGVRLDKSVGTPSNGQVVAYDSTLKAWKSGSAAASASTTFPMGNADTSTVQKIIVPLYIYPTLAGWTNYYTTSPKTGIVIANPNNGPDVAQNSDYVTGIAGMHTNGIAVIGYVHTRVTPGGAFRALATVQAEVDSWYSFYSIDGIFFDQADSIGAATEVAYFTSLYNYVRTKNSRNLVVLNPGTNASEAYASVSDIICTSENTYSTYSGSYIVDAWTRKYPASKFCHIVHTCTPANYEAAINLTKNNRAGWVYVTDDPATYIVNPSYLVEEITRLGLVDGRFPMIFAGANGTTDTATPTRSVLINPGTGVTVSTSITQAGVRSYQISSSAAPVAGTNIAVSGSTVSVSPTSTAAGDLLLGNGTYFALLARGAASTALTVSAGNVVGWTTITAAMLASTTGSGSTVVLSSSPTITSPTINFGSDAQGDLIVRGASVPGRLGLGAQYLVPMSNGTTVVYGPGYSSLTGPTNQILNGDFQVWEYGATSFTPAAATDTYTADRWIANVGTGGAATCSQQAHTVGQAVVPNEPRYFYRFNQTGGGTGGVYLTQKILDVRTFAGQSATVSLWAKVSSGTLTVTPTIIQNFGSGGSPSAAVTTAGSVFSVTSAAFAQYSFTFSVPSISGKTIGTTDRTSFLQLKLAFPLSTTFQIDVSDVQFEIGSTNTQFARRPYLTELNECDYFHQRLTASGANANAYGSGVYYSTTVCRNYVPFKRVMRVAPTATTSAASTFQVINAGGSNVAGSTISALNVGDRALNIDLTTAASTAGSGGVLNAAGSTSFIDLSAEL